jgi:class 3 adenylate cyclase
VTERVSVQDPLAAGRRAADAADWPEAYARLSEAGAAQGELEPADLVRFAKSAWWTGKHEESVEAHERAYAGFLQAGDPVRAAFMALTLRREYSAKLKSSVAMGWLKRAEGLLAEHPDSSAHVYLAIAHGELAASRGEHDHALEHIERGIALAQRFDDPNLRAWTLMRKGMVLVSMGRLDEGWAHMEEVSAAAVGGELGRYTTGAVFCNVISMSRDLADYGRASEWADAATRWCEQQSLTGFPGICRVHRAEVLRLVGSWTEAEAEFRRASEELYHFSPGDAGTAFHELGEVRLRVGDLAAASEAFATARELGADPHPGAAMLLLAEGKVAEAAASIRRSLDEIEWDKLARARRLPAQVVIARAAGDAATARAAADELAAIVEEFDTPALRAEAATAAGIVALMEGDAGLAADRFRRARRRWGEIDAAYDVAVATARLGEAYLAEGDRESGVAELERARASFVKLGAEPDTRAVAGLLERAQAPAAVARVERTFMFTDIVGSTALLDVIGDAAWATLRRWHDETLRACFGLHGGEEIDHAGDGFFLAFPDPRAAVTCAIEIQQRLDAHRREHGFAPSVRIGIHADAANREGSSYSGKGVHQAARIAALGAGDEIVASLSTVEGLPDVTPTHRREVPLKGLPEPVPIVSIDWRA